MPQDNKKYQNTDASILVLKDGFSFCTQAKSYFYPITKSSKLKLEDLYKWAEQEQLTIQNPSITHFNGIGTIVPLEMFDEKSVAFYLSKGATTKDYEEVSFDIIEQSNQAIVYNRTIEHHSLLKELSPKSISQHYISRLLSTITSFSINSPKKNLFIHLQSGSFDIFLFQGRQLLFFNSFPQQNVDEFLYYLFYVIEQFYLKPENFNLAFLGEYHCFKEYYQSTKEYHSNIIFLDTPTKNASSEHPIPFFENKLF